jgi:hypothetical protein
MLPLFVTDEPQYGNEPEGTVAKKCGPRPKLMRDYEPASSCPRCGAPIFVPTPPCAEIEAVFTCGCRFAGQGAPPPLSSYDFTFGPVYD